MKSIQSKICIYFLKHTLKHILKIFQEYFKSVDSTILAASLFRNNWYNFLFLLCFTSITFARTFLAILFSHCGFHVLKYFQIIWRHNFLALNVGLSKTRNVRNYSAHLIWYLWFFLNSFYAIFCCIYCTFI